MTPFGRYKFLKAHFGICFISEHYNRHMDEAFQGLKNYYGVVDNIIIFDEDKDTHVARVREFLKRCPKKGISLHKEKFKFGVTSVTFSSYNLSRDGYKVYSSLLKAIRDFSLLTNATDLRSFFALANQLSSYADQIAKCLRPLRPFLSVKNKFLWGSEHSRTFQLAKEALSEVPTLAFRDIKKPTRIMTVASSKGLWFCAAAAAWIYQALSQGRIQGGGALGHGPPSDRLD